jgi:heat shock protein HslJ
MTWASPTRAFARITLFALAISVTACIALLRKDDPAIGSLALTGSTWMTMTVDGASVPVDVMSTLTFPSDAKIAGNGGCNPYSASLGVAANELDIGPISRGRRECGPEVMAAESRFLAALQKVRSFHGTELFLYLYDEYGAQRVSLSRVPDAAPQGSP